MPRNKNGVLLGEENEQAQSMRKLCIDFASEVRKMRPFIDQIVVAVDSKSWRKDLFPEAEYKGTRTVDETVNWTAVYHIYDEFRVYLAKQGVIIQQTNGAEADDILFARATRGFLQAWSTPRRTEPLRRSRRGHDAQAACPWQRS